MVKVSAKWRVRALCIAASLWVGLVLASGCGGPERKRPRAAVPCVAESSDADANRQRRRAAIEAAMDYVIGAIASDGRVRYRARADGTVLDGYNVVRHAGTMFALAVGLRANPRADGIAALNRGTNGLRAFLVRFSPTADALVYRGKIKLGGVALAALAEVEAYLTTAESHHLDAANRYAGYLLEALSPDGAFIHQRSWPSRATLPFVSRYYPGEAIFALARLYEVGGDPRFLAAARQAARYLIEVRDRGLEIGELDHDHWLLYGLEVLDRCAPDQAWWEHGQRIAGTIVKALRAHPGSCQRADFGTTRSAPIATRIEGLMAAVRMALARGQRDQALAWRAAAERVESTLLDNRVHRGPLAGGFVGDTGGRVVRIDVVQHALSALSALDIASGDGDPNAAVITAGCQLFDDAGVSLPANRP